MPFWVSGLPFEGIGGGECESSESMSGITSWLVEPLVMTDVREEVEMVRAKRAAIGRKSDGPPPPPGPGEEVPAPGDA